ncbi:MAG: glycosyltransferase [Candidatus Gastranaerophilales bacterium]|nr:glycosyltransferase [Candidatus Gastranaerophilales bacterium]
MRIAMFTNNYKPYMAGVPISIEHLSEALRQAGHVVYVFAPSYEGQVDEEYVIRYPSFPIKIVGAPIPNVLTTLFDRKVRELQIDVIHVHHPALVGNIALMLRKKYGIPVVYTYHTRYEEYLHYVKALQIVEACTGIVEKYLAYFCRRCDLILTPTLSMKKYLNRRGMNVPMEVLPTGLPRQNFAPDAKRAAEIRKRYIGNADFLFCTISRLAKEKNLYFQLEGLKLLKERLGQQGKTFRHLFIGEGPERERLSKKAKELGLADNIILAGRIENAKIPLCLKAADAFLFSSKSETQGIVILEAMAAGIPVVAVKASGVEDIVREKENGFLVDEDPTEWAERILLLTEDEEVKSKLAENVVKTAEEYSEAQIAKQAVNYYLYACQHYWEESWKKQLSSCQYLVRK